MAIIGPVTLAISRSGANAIVDVTYTITGNIPDRIERQKYMELCRLIGDDTPGDGTDDVVPNGTLREKVVEFSTTNFEFSRALQITLPASFLNEDSGGPVSAVDEIRAVVTLTPVVPKMSTRESNQVLFNVPVNQFG
jgi:hypothetical protein